MRRRLDHVFALGLVSLLGAGVAPQAQAADAGDLDRSFASDGRKLSDFFDRSDRAEALAVQGNGKLVVAGDVSRRRGPPRLAVARYRLGGRIDRRFGDEGKVVVNDCSPQLQNRFSVGNDVAVQANGKVVVVGICGRHSLVVRFRRDGELDRSFGDRGKVITGLGDWNISYGVAIQPDGKIVAVGQAPAEEKDAAAIIRYRRDGILDATFAGDGTLVSAFGQDAYVRAIDVAVQPDGKLVVAGYAGNKWMVARLLAGGAPDPGFGDMGVQVDGPILTGLARSLAIQPDGTILAAGTTQDPTFKDFNAFGLASYLPDGSPDDAFGTDGAAFTTFSRTWRYNQGAGLAVQNDGKIVVAGTASLTYRAGRHARLALARYLPSGELDQGFGNRGKTTTDLRPDDGRLHADVGSGVVVQESGRIVVGGSSSLWRGYPDFALAGYLGNED